MCTRQVKNLHKRSIQSQSIIQHSKEPWLKNGIMAREKGSIKCWSRSTIDAGNVRAAVTSQSLGLGRGRKKLWIWLNVPNVNYARGSRGRKTLRPHVAASSNGKSKWVRWLKNETEQLLKSAILIRGAKTRSIERIQVSHSAGTGRRIIEVFIPLDVRADSAGHATEWAIKSGECIIPPIIIPAVLHALQQWNASIPSRGTSESNRFSSPPRRATWR